VSCCHDTLSCWLCLHQASPSLSCPVYLLAKLCHLPRTLAAHHCATCCCLFTPGRRAPPQTRAPPAKPPHAASCAALVAQCVQRCSPLTPSSRWPSLASTAAQRHSSLWWWKLWTLLPTTCSKECRVSEALPITLPAADPLCSVLL
jgi:hypothetical protein